jgi:hypothetical protein
MMTQFQVQDYKCLGNVSFPLTPIHVLIAENDAGKSSVLEAMYALYRSASHSLEQAFAGSWEGRELVRESCSNGFVALGGQWRGNGDTAAIDYRLQVEFPPTGRTCRLSSEAFRVDGGAHTDLPRYQHNTTAVCHSRGQGGVDANVRGIVDTVARLLNGVQIYRMDPKEMAVPCTLDNRRKFRMDRDGFGLAGLLDDILGYDAGLFIRLRDHFCEYFPQFRSVRVETVPAIQRNVDHTGVYNASPSTAGKGIFFETKLGTSIRAQQASDGAILFLGFLALLHVPEPPRLLLIEEPETGIYPKRLEEVIHLLKELVSGNKPENATQIVMTTHSPYVLSHFKPDEVTFLTRESESFVTAKPLRDAPHIEDRMGKEFYLGELWYNLTQEELFANA